ncbi:protein kinase [Kitasatospora sp. NPDC049285]|uniref:serine/threonine-protein kinase n=1 Tax=Kitasatospora sp. NPDC049285 TaxID=3157096 RepID=UPI003424C735
MWGRGTVLGGRYALTERLGSGAMGEVWRADDRVLGRQVAVKIVLPALMEDETFAARFRREATVLAAMNHRGVVHIHDYGEDGSDPTAKTAYIVMELLAGGPLDKVRGRKGSYPPDRALDVAAQVLDALHAAHQQGIVHRDIKPSNLMVDQDGRVTVTDFGIARTLADTRITTAHAVIGTALYMAPERAEGKDASAASDLYSVGVVLYELLAGKLPFNGETPLEVVLKHVRDPLPELPEGVPAPVRAVVARALAKQPQDRYPDAAAMAVAARQAMSTPAGLGAVVALAGPDEASPAAPAAPAPAAPVAAEARTEPTPSRDSRNRRRLVALVLPLVVVTGGVTAHQLDLMPWQSGPGGAAVAKSSGTPGATGSPVAATGPSAGAPAAGSTAPPATDAAGNPLPPGTPPDGAPAAGTGSNPGTGTGTGSNPGTAVGGNAAGGGAAAGGAVGGGAAAGGNAGGNAGGSGSTTTTPPSQPKPTTAKPTTPANGCGGSGWGRLTNVGDGLAIGLGSDSLTAGVSVVAGGYTGYGWIKTTDDTGMTTFTACKPGSTALGVRYAGSPSIAELGGSTSYGDTTVWALADAGSGTFQVKFPYGPGSCLTDHGSGNQLTVESCTPGAKSQLFRFG